MLPDTANLTGPEDLVVVQEGDLVDVLELARQAEASDLGGGTLEVIDRTVDRFCRDYPTAAPAVLVRRAELRLHYLAKLLRPKLRGLILPNALWRKESRHSTIQNVASKYA
jgi:hypothetical protein